MGIKPYQDKIIRQMIEQERLVSELYAMFAKDFPEYSDFWNELSEEEKKHAELIEKLGEAEKKGLVLFDEGKTRTYTLTTFIDHIEKQIQRARDKEFTIGAALSCANDIEQSLIEKEVFTRFDSVAEKAGVILNRLREDTKIHSEKLKNKKNEVVRR